MLIQTFKPNDIVTMKMITGEEVIAKLVSNEDNTYRVSKPLVLSITPQGPAMTPFLLTADLDNEINLSKNFVIAIATTESSTKNHYIKGTTGIEPVTTSDITKII